MTDKNEVFNVEVHSTRPDGYRRGGFRLTRGTNRLEMVDGSALQRLRSDTSLLVKDVVPASGSLLMQAVQTEGREDSLLSNAKTALSLRQETETAAGTQLLADDVTPLDALIATLTPEQFTQSGLPDTKALSALAGRPVSAAERDAAWQQYQQRQQEQG